MHRRTTLAATLAVGLLTADTPAQDGRLLGVSGGSTATLYDVDPDTGDLTSPRPLDIRFVADLIFDGDGSGPQQSGGQGGNGEQGGEPPDTLYGLTTIASTGVPNGLVKINPDTGAVLFLDTLAIGNIFEGDLARHPATGQIYGIQRVGVEPPTRDLFAIDTTSATATIIGPVQADDGSHAAGGPDGDLSALAFDPCGNLFAIDAAQSTVIRIDPATADVIDLVPLSQPLGATVGMTYDPRRETFLVADGGHGATNFLHTLDVTTGQLEPIALLRDGNTITGLSGITFVEQPRSICDVAGGTGAVGILDLLLYLQAWIVQDPDAELDGTPGIGTRDLLVFIACWFGQSGDPCR